MESQVENQIVQWLEHELGDCCLGPQSDCEAEALADDRRQRIPVLSMHENAIRPKTSDILVMAARTERFSEDGNLPHPCRLIADVQVSVRTAALGDDRDNPWCEAAPIHTGRVDAVFSALHADKADEALEYMKAICEGNFGIYCFSFQGSDTALDPERNGRIWTGSWAVHFWVGELDG